MDFPVDQHQSNTTAQPPIPSNASNESSSNLSCGGAYSDKDMEVELIGSGGTAYNYNRATAVAAAVPSLIEKKVPKKRKRPEAKTPILGLDVQRAEKQERKITEYTVKVCIYI